MTAQCEAVAPATTYTPQHRCLKRHGLERSGRKILCPHHRRAAGRAGRAAATPPAA